MQVTTYGLDLAKRVMQLHWVDMETGEIHRKQMKRRALLEFFANRQPDIVAMEACIIRGRVGCVCQADPAPRNSGETLG